MVVSPWQWRSAVGFSHTSY